MDDQMTDVVHKLATDAGFRLLRAITDAESNLSTCSDEVKKLLQRGVEQIKEDRYENAIRSFDKAASLDPTNISPRLRMMKVYRAQDEDLTALVLGGGALNLATEPKSRSQIYNFLGEISVDIFKLSKHTNHIIQAINFYDESIDEFHQDILPRWNRVKAYVLYRGSAETDETKAEATKRAKSGIETVLRMGQDHVGNCGKYWMKLLNDVEKGHWWPDNDWWSEKYSRMKQIAERMDVVEDPTMEISESVGALDNPRVRKMLQYGLIAAGIVMAILGLLGFPTGAEAGIPFDGMADFIAQGDVRSYTLLPESALGVEHDWGDLTAIEPSWGDLQSIEHDWDDIL